MDMSPERNAMSRREKVRDLIRTRRAAHLERIREYLAEPSVSQEGVEGVTKCASLVAAKLKNLGCQVVEVVEKEGLPAVWASYDVDASRTLAIYNYLDTTVVGKGWDNDPYKAVLAERPPFKEVVYGRGAGSKGSLMAFINALSCIREIEGELPINVMFLVEGEEFLGSVHMPSLIERYRDHLSRADSCIWPGPCQSVNGDIALFLGTKGCLKVELECSGDRWGRGPAGGPAHSSTQGVVDSPTWRLIHALATLYDPEESRILVDGFCEDLRKPTEAEMAMIRSLGEQFRGKEAETIPNIVPSAKVERFVRDLKGADVFRRYCFEPTMNIDGIRAGYTGPGTAFWTLPNAAYCTIDHRLPLDMDPEKCLVRLRSHLDRHGYSDIAIKTLMTVSPQGPSIDDDIVRAALDTFKLWDVNPVLWPCKGTSGPAGHFNKLLGLSVLGSTGMSYTSGFSGPNEFLVTEGNGRVGGLVEMEQSFADLIYAYASYQRGR
jgi:acetylornithine deacetylase/succinyl-diaminopimelate desuccinylase-like protein